MHDLFTHGHTLNVFLLSNLFVVVFAAYIYIFLLDIYFCVFECLAKNLFFVWFCFSWTVDKVCAK